MNRLELIEEYENNEGDMDIICLGGEIQKCHSCVISCQSPIMRRSIENNLGRDQLNCTKFSKQTMAKLLQIMYCSDASFDYANEMIEVRYFGVTGVYTMIAIVFYTAHPKREALMLGNKDKGGLVLDFLRRNSSREA